MRQARRGMASCSSASSGWPCSGADERAEGKPTRAGRAEARPPAGRAGREERRRDAPAGPRTPGFEGVTVALRLDPRGGGTPSRGSSRFATRGSREHLVGLGAEEKVHDATVCPKRRTQAARAAARVLPRGLEYRFWTGFGFARITGAWDRKNGPNTACTDTQWTPAGRSTVGPERDREVTGIGPTPWRRSRCRSRDRRTGKPTGVAIEDDVDLRRGGGSVVLAVDVDGVYPPPVARADAEVVCGEVVVVVRTWRHSSESLVSETPPLPYWFHKSVETPGCTPRGKRNSAWEVAGLWRLHGPSEILREQCRRRTWNWCSVFSDDHLEPGGVGLRELIAADVEYVNPSYAVEPGYPPRAQELCRRPRHLRGLRDQGCERIIDAGERDRRLRSLTPPPGPVSGVPVEGEHGYVSDHPRWIGRALSMVSIPPRGSRGRRTSGGRQLSRRRCQQTSSRAITTPGHRIGRFARRAHRGCARTAWTRSESRIVTAFAMSEYFSGGLFPAMYRRPRLSSNLSGSSIRFRGGNRTLRTLLPTLISVIFGREDQRASGSASNAARIRSSSAAPSRTQVGSRLRCRSSSTEPSSKTVSR